MRLLLFGSFGSGNLGDEATLRSMIRSWRAHLPDAALTVASLAPERHGDLPATIVHAHDAHALGGAIADADLVIVAGGRLWRDPHGLAPGDFFRPALSDVAHAARPLLTAAALGTRSALFASGIGPLASPEARRVTAALAALAAHVSVREDESADLLRAAGFTGGLLVVADPAFAIVPDAGRTLPARRLPRRLAVVPASRLDGPIDTLERALTAALRDVGDAIEIVLISFESGADLAELERLRDALALPPDVVRIVAPTTPEEAAGWLGTCDVALAAQAHAVILAAVAGTPAVALGDDPALLGHARLLGLADLALDAKAATPAAITRAVEHVLTSRATMASGLAARVEVARTLLAAGYQAVAATAAAPPTPAADERARGELAAYERACSRLRTQLEQREESWRTLAGLVGQDIEAVEPVSTGVAQRSRDLRMLRRRAEAAEVELETIKRSLGWRLLNRYGRLKHHYLLPAMRFLRRRRPAAAPQRAEPDPDPVADGVTAAFDVVCFPIIDWDFRFQRPQHLMSRFAAAGHRVFYLAPEFAASGEPFTLEEKAPNVWRVTLRGPRRNVWTEALDPGDADRVFASLNRLRAQLSLGATLVCVQLPFWWPLAALARERFGWPILYDCMDHHAGFSTHTGATGDHERQLFAGADHVVVSSAQLEQVARPLARRLHLVRNGCEYEHFEAAAGGRRGDRPVIGFYGAIADWFDADLVADLAERRPDWDFLLVGSTDMGDVARLAALPNVRLPGEQPYADIPGWLAKMDVTLLPFKRLPLTEATNPVKAYEILASGKTLVSVPLPEMRPLAPLVRLAATVDEFEREITAALASEDAVLIARRQAFAKANTWEVRFAELAALAPTLFPKASTVIVTYNNLDMTRRCLDSVFARTDWPQHEVIVVDNASTDGTPDFLRALPERHANVTVICNDDNRGFAAACNQGLAQATGEYLVLLNNDTVVTRRWLSAMIRHLVAVPEIGLIGPVTNEIGNESKIAVQYQSLDDMPAWAARFTRDNDDRLRSMHMLAMFCVAMRRQTFTEVGPLDERFAIGMFEDDDYSRRIRSRGYTIVSARDAFVHHAGGASFKQLDRERYRRVFERNRRLYERKWGLWTPHQDEATLPRIDALRTRLTEIVAQAGVQSHHVAVFLRSAASPTPFADRTQHLAEALARLGMLVFLDRTGDDDREGFREVAPRLWHFGGPTGVLEQLEAPLVWALPYNGLDAFRWVRRTLVYDLADVLTAFPFEEPLLRDNHERLLREAEVVVCASRGLLESVRPLRPDAVYIPNGAVDPAEPGRQAALDPAFAALLASGRPIAAYAGPVDAHFDAAWLEAVARRRPEWTFVVFGARREDAPALEALEACENVRLFTPPARDMLASHLARVTAGVVPIAADGGAAACPVAVYDLVASGAPVVATAIAECTEVPHVTTAATPAAAAEALEHARIRTGKPGARERIRLDAREHAWTIRAQHITELIRRHRRAQRRSQEPPARRHADALAGQRSYRGTCNVCGQSTFFHFEREALYRESLFCVECLSTSRYRSLARGILRALRELTGVDAESLAELADLPTQRVVRVYDTQVPFYWASGTYPLPDLLARCNWIEMHTSSYKPREPLGRALGPRSSNQNLERLTFADDSFDLVITSDVMEHVRLDDRAHAEIRRVLRPDGIYLFTVPHYRDRAQTTVRVAIVDPDDPARDRHLLEPEYHGDANSEEDRALAYRTYGTDLDRTLERLGFAVDYAKDDVPELGILNTELFYCRVIRAALAALPREWPAPDRQHG